MRIIKYATPGTGAFDGGGGSLRPIFFGITFRNEAQNRSSIEKMAFQEMKRAMLFVPFPLRFLPLLLATFGSIIIT